MDNKSNSILEKGYSKKTSDNIMRGICCIGIGFICLNIKFFVLAIVLLISGCAEISYVFYRIKKQRNQKVLWEYLQENGILVKGLKYDLVWDKIVVNYKLKDGSVVKLKGPEIVGKDSWRYHINNADNLVDVLIDPNDVNKYYIDFNIDKID